MEHHIAGLHRLDQGDADAELGITVEPRPDHAQYLAHWLTVLKADKRAIFTAASKAREAAAFLSEKRV